MSTTPQPQSLDPDDCRSRQKRLLDVLARSNADRAIFVQAANVQYLTGFRPHHLMSAAVSLDADGFCTLVAPNSEPEQAAADRIVTYEAQWHATLRQEQAREVGRTLRHALTDRATPGRLAIEFSTCGRHVLSDEYGCEVVETVDVEPELWRLRRCKDADELTMIGRAIDCSQAMYQRAREIITPGITEIEVYSQLHAAAVEVAGEPLTACGNDYQCNSPGGPPRPRRAQAGELFILDLGPAYRGYYADNCRTIAVDGSPNEAQQQAWNAIVSALETVEATVRPGVSCRGLYEEIKAQLDDYRPGWFTHHLGHAIGLFPHEGPHLNPHWDDVFEEGDVFTAEPGLYDPELKAGIRLEQNYRVTSDSVERLTSFPLDL